MSSLTKKTHRYLFPAVNVKRRSEAAEIDEVYCDSPAIDDGSKCAQVVAGAKTLASDTHGMKSDK